VNPYRIVIADDHVIFRQGMKRLIEEMEGMEVVGEANDGLELLGLLNKLTPDMVLLDISMPNLRGIEATREIKTINERIKVLILTMHKNMEYLYHTLSAGAEGYLLKEDSDLELLSAIKAIRGGEIYVTKILSTGIVKELELIYKGKRKPTTDPLTIREREILKLIAEGKTNKGISQVFNISIRTVENHRANIMKKLNLYKTAELVKYSIQKGITGLNI
jgi:DNA-binding NarL/FixJ family response regulator